MRITGQFLGLAGATALAASLAACGQPDPVNVERGFCTQTGDGFAIVSMPEDDGTGRMVSNIVYDTLVPWSTEAEADQDPGASEMYNVRYVNYGDVILSDPSTSLTVMKNERGNPQLCRIDNEDGLSTVYQYKTRAEMGVDSFSQFYERGFSENGPSF